MESHEFQESIVVLGPGQRPEDVLEIEPVTLANMSGDTHTYSWAAGRPRRLPAPARANIVVINTKSAQRPYFIVQPGPCLTRDDGPQPAPLFPPYYHETLGDGMKFPWWNHWPTSDIPSDGRRAVAADRASHSSVLTGSEWADHKVTPTSRQRVMLHGLTTARAEELAPLAKSWLNPPALSIAGAAGRYDQVERAYVVDPVAGVSALSLRLEGSAESPALNPAFIFAGWSPRGVRITLDGLLAAEGDAVRIGRRHHADASDLIIWFELDRSEPVTIEVAAA